MIVRFLVGTSEEDALVKVYSKLYSNADRMPIGASQPLVKRTRLTMCRSALTLWGGHYDGYQLRQMADEMQHTIGQIPDVSETTVIGGQPRAMRVVLSTEKLTAYGLSPMAIVGLASCECERAGRRIFRGQSGSPRGRGQSIHTAARIWTQ